MEITDVTTPAIVELDRRLERIRHWQKNPIDYFVDRLGVRRESIDWEVLPEYANHVWDGTRNPLATICKEIAENRWVGVESATGVGKTFLGALIVLWFLECFEDAVVVTTAPKKDQLSLHIWREIGKLMELFGLGELQTLRLRMLPNADDKDRWHAVGFVAGVKKEETERSATKAQGFHAEHMLFVFEETPGIAQAVISAFENTCTAPHNLIVAFGNPDHTRDTLHRFCSQKHVTAVRISAFDHPNVVLNNPEIVLGAQTRQGLDRLLEKYGTPDHMLYQSRAHGLSPQQASDALILWEWCIEAANRGRDEAPSGPKALGVDVANSEAGDKAATAYGEGPKLVSVTDFQCPDSNRLGADVFSLAETSGIEAKYIGVDGVGVGAGTVNELKRLRMMVMDLQSGAKPIEMTVKSVRMTEKFNNLRSQMWWQMRLDLQFGAQSGLSLPMDEDLFADLCTPKWTILNGKIIVESKETLKKRLGRSPNKGDAVVYWNWVRHNPGTVAALAEAGDREDRQSLRTLLDDTTYAAERKRTW